MKLLSWSTIDTPAEQHQPHPKRLHPESELDSQDNRIRKRLRSQTHTNSQADGDFLKEPGATSQFETLSILVQEIQDMKVQLGQLVADFAEKLESAEGLVSIPRTSCKICHGHASGWRVQGEDFEGISTSSDYESQLP